MSVTEPVMDALDAGLRGIESELQERVTHYEKEQARLLLASQSADTYAKKYALELEAFKNGAKVNAFLEMIHMITQKQIDTKKWYVKWIEGEIAAQKKHIAEMKEEKERLDRDNKEV